MDLVALVRFAIVRLVAFDAISFGYLFWKIVLLNILLTVHPPILDTHPDY